MRIRGGAGDAVEMGKGLPKIVGFRDGWIWLGLRPHVDRLRV